jgi:hypothetical protein
MLSPINIIGDVTQLLADLLVDLTPSLDSPADITLQGPNAAARINIYLFQVLEDPYSKNQPWLTEPGGDQRYPPLALDLLYLLTPYASDQPSAHHALGDAMRILHDNAILEGPELSDSLRLAVDQLAIVLVPMEIEDLTRIWNALQSPYRLSVCYQIRILLVESQITVTPSRVLARVNSYAQK